MLNSLQYIISWRIPITINFVYVSGNNKVEKIWTKTGNNWPWKFQDNGDGGSSCWRDKIADIVLVKGIRNSLPAEIPHGVKKFNLISWCMGLCQSHLRRLALILYAFSGNLTDDVRWQGAGHFVLLQPRTLYFCQFFNPS